MKILHTSDWHLGHTLYNYDRSEEQTAMLRQMANIVSEQRPDVFLLCGDVYHTPQPSAAVQTLFTNALVEIHKANPEMTIVITAGNHDSGTKHEIFRIPWRSLDVHTIGNLDKTNIEKHIIEVPGKGYVVAIPYTNERSIPDGFIQQILDIVARRNTDRLPVVMSAHTTVSGCDFRGCENTTEYTVGGIESFDIEQLGCGYDYLALGHIHNEQFVHAGNQNVIRYCGAPIAISFDEKEPHSISIVEIEKHGADPEVKKIEINNPRPLVTLPSDGTTSWEEAKRLLKDFPDDSPAYIRLNVEIKDFLPVEANAEAVALTSGKNCRFCHINAFRQVTQRASAKVMTIQEFKKESQSPVDMARRYAEDLNIEFDNEMEKLFDEVLRMVNEDLRNN